MDEPAVFRPRPVTYTSPSGPPIELEAEHVHDLIALADDRSEPGKPVTPSDLVAEAVADFLKGKKQALAGIAKRAAKDERKRVHAEHGGRKP
jgi:hypothetical protein